MIPEVEDEIVVYDVIDFVRKFGLEEKFKKDYGLSVEDWDFSVSDEEVIRDYLSQMKETYFVDYVDDENMGYFRIFKLKV